MSFTSNIEIYDAEISPNNLGQPNGYNIQIHIRPYTIFSIEFDRRSFITPYIFGIFVNAFCVTLNLCSAGITKYLLYESDHQSP